MSSPQYALRKLLATAIRGERVTNVSISGCFYRRIFRDEDVAANVPQSVHVQGLSIGLHALGDVKC